VNATAPARRPPRLRWRLTVAFILVAAASATALATGSYLLIQRSWFDDSQQRAGEDTLRQLVLAEQFLDDPDRADNLRSSFASARRDVIVVVDGQPVASNPGVHPDLPDPLREAVASGRLAYQRIDHAGSRLLVVGGRIGGSPDELYLIVNEDRIVDDLAQLRAVLLLGAAAVTIVAAMVGYVLARRTLEPVGRARAAAHAIAEGLLDTRLPIRSRDEFGAWAESFNQMADALESTIAALRQAHERERRFTADVAHELRTPVTALVAEASLLRPHLDRLPEQVRQPTELLLSDVVRLRHLVEELLEISRLDGEQEPSPLESVDLTAVVQAVVSANGWAGQVQLPAADPYVVVTDPRRVQRVVANLLSNAVVHGGGAEVSLSADGAQVRVRVRDDGPGIAAEHLPRLFDRFYKADPSRSSQGSGLGLAIAAEHARLLGGDIEVTSAPGAGTTFSFTVPVTGLLPPGDEPVGQRADCRDGTTREGGPS
jgi:signal transduction histidine kinase